MIKPRITKATQRWIRNRSDELAVDAGCKFDEKRARFVVDWIQDYCRLYEGEWAGERMELRDWQLEATMRMFGWIQYSQKWQRWVRRFRHASIWTPKKNKKSPTLAAWALYLLCGDNEPGQKVFLGAKDGKQAREIAGTHAVEMVQASEMLSSECTINKNLMRITHEPSRSYMQPLSSGNSRHQESKEGINGCVLIDETHVVDRDFIDRVSRAGISRSEPLQIEVSTSGNNPDGYGKSQYDYGKLVESGEVEDTRFFYLCYEAPQTLSDTELAEDPLKFGRLANPAMGHTVDPDEYLADYTRSKQSISELANFMMYRLNVWQYSANPWLRKEDWDNCYEDYSEQDLIGQPCYAALDLSRTRDMTALCLAFPDEDEVIRYLWWYWLPKEYAKDNASRAPFMQFANDPHCNLTLTPGDVLDFGYVKSHVKQLSERFNVRTLVFDDWNAEKVTQEIVDGTTDRDGSMIETGIGIERTAFAQTVKNFNEPAKEFERRVIAGKVRHNGNALTSWQMHHCTFYEDGNGNIRPLKPKRNDVRKIDGVVVAVMATSEVLFNEEREWTMDELGV